jgi:hypothetical protein
MKKASRSVTMQQRQTTFGIRLGTMAMVLGLAMVVQDGRAPSASAQHMTAQTASTCPGFVVLSNGFAVLSQPANTASEAGSHAPPHGAKTDKAMAHQGGRQPASPVDKSMHKDHESKPQDHLMGYTHGHSITLKEGMLCVPIASPQTTAWKAVSREPSLVVMAESVRQGLAHNSRQNEGFTFTIERRGTQQEKDDTQVRLFVRMPQHDHRMPGGHGPANDPDVTGIEAALDAQGRYTVPTVDFSMAGPWLFEVRIQQDGQTHNAYFAGKVDEE